MSLFSFYPLTFRILILLLQARQKSCKSLSVFTFGIPTSASIAERNFKPAPKISSALTFSCINTFSSKLIQATINAFICCVSFQKVVWLAGSRTSGELQPFGNLLQSALLCLTFLVEHTLTQIALKASRTRPFLLAEFDFNSAHLVRVFLFEVIQIKIVVITITNVLEFDSFKTKVAC